MPAARRASACGRPACPSSPGTWCRAKAAGSGCSTAASAASGRWTGASRCRAPRQRPWPSQHQTPAPSALARRCRPSPVRRCKRPRAGPCRPAMWWRWTRWTTARCWCSSPLAPTARPRCTGWPMACRLAHRPAPPTWRATSTPPASAAPGASSAMTWRWARARPMTRPAGWAGSTSSAAMATRPMPSACSRAPAACGWTPCPSTTRCACSAAGPWWPAPACPTMTAPTAGCH